ncbi:MAG TPA: GH3 auxin-responsive promoter family protein, partial [Chloroflexota bacterium]|nr:GH3 auxin-responsive promoter family protein [Chloroflexota bacterium]
MRRPPSLRVPPVVANTLWYLLSVPPALAFHCARRDVAGTQRRLLLRLLRRNAGTAFGRRYGLASIDSVAAYRERVPLTSYEDYLADVERIGAGEAGVLTADP